MNSTIINIREVTPKQRIFSLPKTQPTKNSSTCHLQQLKNNVQTAQINVDQIQTCPEVSQFNIHDNSIYIHKLNIDYGHLEEPDNWQCQPIVNECHKQQQVIQENVEESLTTQRNQFKFRYARNNEKSTAGKSKSLVKFSGASTSDLEIQPRLILLDSHNKKNTPINQLDQFSPKFTKYNPEAISHKKSKNKLSQTTKLKQIFASKTSVQSIDELKNCSQQSTHRQDSTKQKNYQQKDKTIRTTQHCRIVRSYVGGSKMQIKIINYPDCSEYRKICGYNK